MLIVVLPLLAAMVVWIPQLPSTPGTTFGFYRNLYALRKIGFLSAGVGIVGSASFILIESLAGQVSWAAVLAFAAALTCLDVMRAEATAARVRDAGFDYAIALIRAIDSVPK